MITVQVSKQKEVTPGQLRHTIVERWENLAVITGGSLYGKYVIPLGKECSLDDKTMHHLIEEHNLLLNTNKQRIVANLNDIDEFRHNDIDELRHGAYAQQK
jgi:hypothetical protein